ncbi:MAG: hypothetical protein Q4F98_00295 [Lachnospiraceae bacterium]|nr:hypothetical protein [Lachnospiraceae bacterium]
MGSLILCHKKHARQPFEIARGHIKIYTLEELCYYICNNLYLIDHTLINKQLCEWIRTELLMYELADVLQNELDNDCTEEDFIIKILQQSTMYASSEIIKIQGILEKLQDQREVEKAKLKADSLMKSGEYADAIIVYRSIIDGERDDSVGKPFYAKVYACLAGAYGRLFLYEEAAEAYEESYKQQENEEVLKAYLYCNYHILSEEEYTKMLSGNTKYLNLDAVLKEERDHIRADIEISQEDEEMESEKRRYRGIDSK